MLELAQEINEILARRQIRAQAITKKMEFLQNLRVEIIALKDLQGVVNAQISLKQGQYYALLGNDPVMQANISKIDTNQLLKKLDHQILVLEKMHERFSRKSICISVVGLARQGKSMLLQTITGLGPDVIPTSDGTDCTGAPSIISNVQGGQFQARITFMSEGEIVEAVNKYTAILFPEVEIRSCGDIPLLASRLDELRSRCPKKIEKYLHFVKYVEHYSEYAPFIGKVITCTDEKQVITYVAQHNNPKPKGAPVVYYYKYLAVKSAEIECAFNYSDAGKIVLIDTIGLGDTALGIDTKMLKTISDDSDATILLRRPNPGGDGWNERDVELRAKLQENTLNIDESKWLFVVLNRQNTDEPKFDNRGILPEFKKKVEEVRKDALHCVLLEDIDISDRKELGEKLVYPMLHHMSENLDEIDDLLMKRANEQGKELYGYYSSLCNQVSTVLTSNAKRNIQAGMLFDELYEKLPLSHALGELMLRFREQQHTPCFDIKEVIDEKIKNIYAFAPSQESIFNLFEQHRPQDNFPNIFVLKSSETRTHISESFEEISLDVLHPLQEDVKNDVIRLLYAPDGGALGRILLCRGTYDVPSKEWFRAFIDEQLTDYPEMKEAFEFILNYHLSIDGFLEYQVESGLSVLDEDTKGFHIPDIRKEFGSEELLSSQKKAELVWEGIIDNLTHVQAELRGRFDTLIAIPYHSFYARVRKFREKLIVATKGNRELKTFYSEHCYAIWPEEFMSITEKSSALGDWNKMSANLTKQCVESYFLLIKK